MSPLNWNAVYAAAQRRIMELADAALLAKERGVDQLAHGHYRRLLDLAVGLDAVAVDQDAASAAQTTGYLVETYGLATSELNAWGQPGVPPVPAQGGKVVPRILFLNGRALHLHGRPFCVGYGVIPA
ncbi:hypothetical protein [Hymenobacter latericus]|uniref:hypothetical protein n=1 Tax=Hymenobacter sp. YIM 151858-1 TaxID=2987688 RepID=UPI0022260171|nr:hypothetical protein [Hymenobacter sp. YIM 151858-1]UYZ60125.1 hypothetical protein OIS50_04815 [Hymenobacter sp. YIM 151858-1]